MTSYLWNSDGIKVQRANFDLLEEEVGLGAPRSRLAPEGQRVAVRQLPQDARLQAHLVHPRPCKQSGEGTKTKQLSDSKLSSSFPADRERKVTRGHRVSALISRQTTQEVIKQREARNKVINLFTAQKKGVCETEPEPSRWKATRQSNGHDGSRNTETRNQRRRRRIWETDCEINKELENEDVVQILSSSVTVLQAERPNFI